MTSDTMIYIHCFFTKIKTHKALFEREILFWFHPNKLRTQVPPVWNDSQICVLLKRDSPAHWQLPLQNAKPLHFSIIEI